MKYLKVKEISCDRCEYLDSADKFPDIINNKGEFTLEGKLILNKFGWDLSDHSDVGHIQCMYTGAICPECGNLSSFDFDPFDRRGQLRKSKSAR